MEDSDTRTDDEAGSASPTYTELSSITNITSPKSGPDFDQIEKHLKGFNHELQKLRKPNASEHVWETALEQLASIQTNTASTERKVTVIENDIKLIKNQNKANFKNGNARAHNASPKTLRSPLAPLVTDENNPIKNFPIDMQSLHEMAYRDMRALCKAMGLQSEGTVVAMRNKIFVFIGVVNAPQV